MSDDTPVRSGTARRSVLRSVGALAAGVIGAAGSATAAGDATLTIEADAAEVDGLAAAAVEVAETADGTRVRHEYAWDPDADDSLDVRPRVALQLDVPTDLSVLEDPTEIGGLEELSGATAVLEDCTADSSLLGLTDDADGSGDWDLVPYVETTSPLCGTLAESNLRIDRAPAWARAAYADAALDTNAYDYTCEDEWYVPPEYNTIWHVDDRDLQRAPRSIDADATYYNDDFPNSDRVWADHCFAISPTSHRMRYEHSGDWSKYLLELRSETGYRG